MGQAIMTHYVGPRDRRGARIIAKAWGGRTSVPYDQGLSHDANHLAGAKALAAKLGWEGAWIEGTAPDGDGHVYVQQETEAATIAALKLAADTLALLAAHAQPLRAHKSEAYIRAQDAIRLALAATEA